MKTTRCLKCNAYIRNNNIKKHELSCNGVYKKYTKSDSSKYFKKNWDILGLGKIKGDIANHVLWCEQNPNINVQKSNLHGRTKLMEESRRESGFLNAASKAKILGESYVSPLKGIPNTHFKNHTDETIKKIKDKALASDHRRLRKGTILYKGILLDSSWELELAKRLDFLNINWIRPKNLKWKDQNGIEHNYFPDFYLIDYDLYLDPKNPAAFINQKEKIEILNKTYSNIVFLKTLQECKNFSVKTTK